LKDNPTPARSEMPDNLLSRSSIDQTTLSRKMLSDQVKEYIIAAILNGTYPAGTRIIESALAKQLGVSQGPVREAIRGLVVMGFLINEPYKGTTVRTFTAQELHEVYSVRAALESLAGRLAALHITEDDLATLRGILDEMITAAQHNEIHLMVQNNNLFRNTILKISGNQLLYDLYHTLQFADWTIFSTSNLSLDLEFLAKRHETILNALATRDPEIAAAAMRDHIEELDTLFNQVREDSDEIIHENKSLFPSS
jgi:DNA-binding GntR family transcriptional regulator